MGLRIIPSPRRPVRLVSWLRSPLGVVKLSRDGCSEGSPGMSTIGCVLRIQ